MKTMGSISLGEYEYVHGLIEFVLKDAYSPLYAVFFRVLSYFSGIFPPMTNGCETELVVLE